MRVARYIIAAIGLLVIVVFATVEVVFATLTLVDIGTPMPIRMWLMTAILMSLTGTIGLIVIERQCRILKALSDLRAMIAELVSDKRSTRTVEEFKRRYNSLNGSDQNTNVRQLFPEE
jgi:hypothetical protein